MRDKADEIHLLGAELIFVGNGTAEQARAFRVEHGLELPLFTDPTLRLHRAAGLRHGKAASLSPRALVHGWKAMRQGFRQEFIAGDPDQQGGVFVIAPGDEVLFAYRSKAAGDHPDPEAVVLALRERRQQQDVQRLTPSP